MSVSLIPLLWGMPGAQEFLAHVAQDLRNGRSLWILFHDQADQQGFEEALLEYLESDGVLWVRPIGLASFDGATPIEILREALAVDQARVLEDLIREDIPDVVVIQSFEESPLEHRQEWFNAMQRWAEACHSMGARKSLCIVTQARAVLEIRPPATDVRLGVHLWWGIPSALETHLICRMATQNSDALSHWREYLIPSLTAGDLTLGERLWDVVAGSMGEILQCLVLYASERGWSRAATNTGWSEWRPIPPGTDLRPNPQDRSLALWARGWLVYTPEYGEEIHSALLATIGNESEIQHRIWRAQAALLLPSIDSVRLTICQYLLRHHGEGWHQRPGQPETDGYAELGELEVLLRNTPHLEWEREQWLRVVCLARQIRNNLAHYALVSFAEFAEFWQLSRRVHRMGWQNVPT